MTNAAAASGYAPNTMPLDGQAMATKRARPPSMENRAPTASATHRAMLHREVLTSVVARLLVIGIKFSSPRFPSWLAGAAWRGCTAQGSNEPESEILWVAVPNVGRRCRPCGRGIPLSNLST